MIAPYGAFPVRDGEIMIAAANDNLFRRLCRALGLDELSEDARFRDNPSRVAHREVLRAVIEPATSRFDVASLLELLRREGVPCAPVQDRAAVSADPQTAASEILRDAECAALPLRFDGLRVPARGRVPGAGEDGSEAR
jgi:crotonobetainyl-CoA:carnitine CoA-transferase CaiB-like acyl-CoA transferase